MDIPLLSAPPVLGNHSPELIVRKQDESVDMFCEGRGTPTPTLTWYKDGKELTSGGQVSNYLTYFGGKFYEDKKV